MVKFSSGRKEKGIKMDGLFVGISLGIIILGVTAGATSVSRWIKKIQPRKHLIKRINTLLEQADDKYEVSAINGYEKKQLGTGMTSKFDLKRDLASIIDPLRAEIFSSTKTLRNMEVKTVTFTYQSRFFGGVASLVAEYLSGSMKDYEFERELSKRFETAITGDIEHRFLTQ